MAENKSLGRRFTELLDDTVSRTDVEKLFKQLIDFVKEFKSAYEQNMASNKDETTTQLQDHMSRIEEMQSELQSQLQSRVNESNELSRSEARTMMRMLEQATEDLRDEIPELYDDAELRELITTVESKIPVVPPQFDPSNILSELTGAMEKIEELEKKIAAIPRPALGGRVFGPSQIRHHLKNQTPSGTPDGVETDFVMVKAGEQATVAVYVNGVRQDYGSSNDYTIAGKTITFTAGSTPQTGDKIRYDIEY